MDVSGRAAATAQRRQLTVLFCDLVGSTGLAAELDPEDLHDLTKSFLRFCASRLESFGGYVARYAGDGVLAYFGYPAAQEGNAASAIEAAIAIRDGLCDLPTPAGKQLSVRVGIATGLVVVGDMIGHGPSAEHLVAGEAPNLAARLQSTAQPGSILVSEATRQLAGAHYRFREVGDLQLKGFPHVKSAWEALAVQPAADRFALKRGSAELIGREQEMGTLRDLWDICRKGAGGLVSILGEPGIGKSRLAYELTQHALQSDGTVLAGSGVQVFSNTPYYVAAQLIRQATRPRDEHRRAAGANERATALVSELTAMGGETTANPQAMTGSQRRETLMSALIDCVVDLAKQGPCTIVIEDLHWVDPSSVEFLERLTRHIAALPVLILLTSRTGHLLDVARDLPQSHVLLEPLAPDLTEQIVRDTGGKALAAAVVSAIATRAQGVPLFAVELARLLEHERPLAPADRTIPNTLADLLTARIDQLGALKRQAQLAAVLGEEFSIGLFGALCGLTDADREVLIAELTHRGILVRSDRSDHLRFRHVLLRDAVYNGLLKSERKSLHRELADLIVRDFPGMAAAHADVLAQHWTAAEQFHKAIEAWQEAGRAAKQRHAYKEAERALARASVLFGRLPDAPGNAAWELEAQCAYASLLQITRGYSSPEAIRTAEVVRKLVERVGDVRKQFTHTANEWMAASSAGDYQTANERAQRVLILARAIGRPDMLGLAHMALLTSYCRRGDLRDSERAFEAGRAHFDTPEFRRRTGASAQTFGNAALNAWLLGDAAQARTRIDTCVEHARQGGDPYELAFALHMAALLFVCFDEPAKADTLATQSIELADKHEYAQFSAISRVVLGKARLDLGAHEDALCLMRRGIEDTGATTSRNGRTMYLTWLAEAQAASGDPANAIATLSDALSINRQELFYRPATLFLSARLHAARGDEPRARADLAEALGLSKAMEAAPFHSRVLTLASALDFVGVT